MEESILVIDDDPVLRDALASVLRAEGFRVGCVEDGQEALDLLNAGVRPSVILLDLHTPRMDGLEFRRRQLLSPALSEIPVVVLTADLDREPEARRLGVAFYLRKPVPFPQLARVLAHFAAGA